MRAGQGVVIGCAAGCVVLVALIVWSSFEMSLGAGLREIVRTRWGITTMADLYAGLVLGGAWIAWRERRIPVSAAWIVALMLLGNLALLAYVALAARRCSSVEELLMAKGSGATRGRA